MSQGAIAPLRMEGIVAVANHREQNKGESCYSLLFFAGGRWYIRVVFPLLGIALGGAFYVWYTQHSSDASPDSPAGFAYAITGTIFLLLAAVLYTLRRRALGTQAVARLNSSLTWHISFGVLGL